MLAVIRLRSFDKSFLEIAPRYHALMVRQDIEEAIWARNDVKFNVEDTFKLIMERINFTDEHRIDDANAEWLYNLVLLANNFQVSGFSSSEAFSRASKDTVFSVKGFDGALQYDYILDQLNKMNNAGN
ncbi:MAG: hypothetical protein WCH76_03665 [Candidatus Riflemargulisbacteria bacterium]